MRGRLQHKPIAVAESRAGATLKLALRNPITGVPRAREAHKLIAVAESILDQGNPKPGKVEVWVVRGGGSA